MDDDTGTTYQFYPEDFEGDTDPTDQHVDRAPLVIASCIGVGGLLFLADPLVDSFDVAGVEIRLVVLSAVVLATGLLLGSAIYCRRGIYRIGLAHGVGGIGWILVVFGTAYHSTPLLASGLVVLFSGTSALAFLSWQSTG